MAKNCCAKIIFFSLLAFFCSKVSALNFGADTGFTFFCFEKDETKIDAPIWKFGIDAEQKLSGVPLSFGIEFDFGFSKMRDLKIVVDDKTFTNDGVFAFDLNFALPIKFESAKQLNFCFTPKFNYGKAKFSDGDLYYFYGTPSIDYFLFAGLDFSVNNYGARFFYANADIGLCSHPTSDFSVFKKVAEGNLVVWGGSLTYGYDFNFQKSVLGLSADVTFAYANFPPSGFLSTTDIQDWRSPFWPIKSITFDASAKSFVFAPSVKLSWKNKWISVGGLFSVLSFFDGTSSIEAQIVAKPKKLPIDIPESVSTDIDPLFDSVGAVAQIFSTVHIKQFDLNISRTIPLLLKNGFSSGEQKESILKKLSVKTLLLSGLSISVSYQSPR